MKRLVLLLISTVGALLVLPMAPAVAAPASSPGVTATWVREDKGLASAYGPVGSERNVVTQILNVRGQQVEVYCIDSTTAFDDAASFAAASTEGSGVNNTKRAAWVLKNAASVAGALADADHEAIARQIAVWHFTNGESLNPSLSTPAIMARASALVAAAGEVTVDPVPTKLTISGKNEDRNVTASAKVTDPSGTPVAGVSVIFTVDGATKTADTDASGLAGVTFEDTDATTMTVQANLVLSVGTIFRPDNNSQLVMLAGPVTIVESVSTDLDVTNTLVAEETTTTTEATPAPTTTAPVKELPYTGQKENIIFLLLGLGAVAGGSFYLLNRKPANA